MDGTRVMLPSGLWVDGVRHREAGLRPLAGGDEAFLDDAGEALLPAARTTALLARCLTRLGPLAEVTPEAVRSLTIGDREALLLHLRRLTLGERLQCVLTCPRPECGEKMDLELGTSDLLVPPYETNGRRHELVASDGGAPYRVRFRLPTGADAEAVAPLALADPRAAAGELLGRCVEDTVSGDGEPAEALPAAVGEAVAAKLGELDPQAELVLNLACPECGHAFSALLDAGTFFFQELAAGVERLYREVHLLAFHYHWSEAEILRLTPRKRRRYLGLLSEALAQ